MCNISFVRFVRFEQNIPSNPSNPSNPYSLPALYLHRKRINVLHGTILTENERLVVATVLLHYLTVSILQSNKYFCFQIRFFHIS